MAETGHVTVTVDDDKIKERMREFLAQAWDEGYAKGADDHYRCGELCEVATEPPNPYRD